MGFPCRKSLQDLLSIKQQPLPSKQHQNIGLREGGWEGSIYLTPIVVGSPPYAVIENSKVPIKPST